MSTIGDVGYQVPKRAAEMEEKRNKISLLNKKGKAVKPSRTVIGLPPKLRFGDVKCALNGGDRGKTIISYLSGELREVGMAPLSDEFLAKHNMPEEKVVPVIKKKRTNYDEGL